MDEESEKIVRTLKELKKSHVYKKMSKSRKLDIDLRIKAFEGDCDALIELSEKLKLY